MFHLIYILLYNQNIKKMVSTKSRMPSCGGLYAWKLFDFCGKVSARLRFSDAILEASNDLERLLEKNQWDNPGIWMYHPKVLYDLIKRKEYLNTLNDRKDICNQELIRHKQILEGIGEQADSETIE